MSHSWWCSAFLYPREGCGFKSHLSDMIMCNWTSVRIYECLFHQLQVNELPLPCIATPDEEVKDILPTSGIDKMKIAWRYEELSQVESSFGNNSIIGHHFDLSRHIDAETIRNSNITYCDLNKSQTIAENTGIVKGRYLWFILNINMYFQIKKYQKERERPLSKMYLFMIFVFSLW